MLARHVPNQSTTNAYVYLPADYMSNARRETSCVSLEQRKTALPPLTFDASTS